MAKPKDISPDFQYVPFSAQVVDTSPLDMAERLGGLRVDSQQLTHGKVAIQGVKERILIGDATEPLTGAGVFMGNDGASTPGYDFRVGDPSGNYLHWDDSANTLTLTGSISATSGTIGGFTIEATTITATNLTLDSAGQRISLGSSNDIVILDADDATYRLWIGNATAASAPFSVTKAGAVTASNITITGGSVPTSVLTGTVGLANTNIAAQGWVFSGVWSVTDADTVAWGAGTFTTAAGTAYSITSGNTGNMAAKTYIYLDIGVSTTAFQTTTTLANTIGSGKVLVAVAQNGTGEANFIVLNDKAYNIDAANIVAGSVTTNEIAANTIVGTNISSLSISGKTLTADTGTIGGWTLGANSLTTGSGSTTVGLDNTSTGADDVRIYAGSSTKTSAPFRVTEAGAVTCTNITVTGGSVATSTLNGTVGLSNTNIAAQGWTFTSTFSATDFNTIAWTSGTFTTAAGTGYSISSGNTGNMAAVTYIYLDIGVSTTVLQTTTTAATAIGTGKVLIAVAQNNSDTTSDAVVQVFGGTGGQIMLVDNIAANSASTNQFVSNSAQIANLVVTNAKINDLDVSKLNAGTITSKSINLAVSDGSGDAEIRSGIATGDFSNSGAATGFIIGVDDSDSNKAKFYFGSATEYISFDGNTFTTTVASQGVKNYVAGENLTAADAVYPLAKMQNTIAFDAYSKGRNSPVSSLTVAHTMSSSSNRILLVFIIGDTTSDLITGVTYNSVAMTRLVTVAPGSRYFYLYYLIAPSTGTHDIVVSASSSILISVMAASYTGVHQTNPFQSYGSQSTGSGNSASMDIYTSQDKGWVVMGSYGSPTSSTNSAGANTTQRGQENVGEGSVSDSNAIITPPGVLTLNTSWTGSASTTKQIGLELIPIEDTGSVLFKTKATKTYYSKSFIGFVKTTTSSGNSAPIVISGEASGFSSLSLVTSQYYLSDTAGAISGSAGTVTRKVGIATSDSTLLITNIW